ncbi:DUF5994 family protein [Streptomyces sp. NPDC050264]|uniref:DUF5994 family protein n=1 Tax=Streptomyces sp. NPDC050264 TaxID=3155038 RepID=UPI00343C7BD1
MTATITPTHTTTPTPPYPAARISLKSPTGQGLLDGAWWPRSRDLSAELPALADALDPLWGRITRVAVNPMLWPVVPRKVTVHERVLKVGWFTPELDPHKLLLLSYGSGRRDLLVIPPETTAANAARLMAAACDPDGPPLTATDLVAAEIGSRHDAALGGRAQGAQEPGTTADGSTAAHVVPTATGR